MFEKPSYHANDPGALRQTWKARAQAAGIPYDEVDLDAGPGCAVLRPGDVHSFQRTDLVLVEPRGSLRPADDLQ